MKVHAACVDKDSGLIHSVVVTAANMHGHNAAAEMLDGDVEVVYANAGYQGIAKRTEMTGIRTLSGWRCGPANVENYRKRQRDGCRI